jgi:hypothetical protein
MYNHHNPALYLATRFSGWVKRTVPRLHPVKFCAQRMGLLPRKEPMKIFFDTEFSHLGSDWNPERHLISIALVSMDGREFYAEPNDTWDDNLCSMFTLKTVIPLLQGGEHAMSISEVNARLKAFIESFDAPVSLVSDAPAYDWPFVRELFDYGGWPANLKRECEQLCFEEMSQRHRYEAALADYWKTHDAKRHHALIDARSMRHAWKYAMRTSRR